MDEAKRIATCDSFGTALRELGMLHDDLFVFDADIPITTMTSAFKRAFPDQYFHHGMTEENMLAVAAGAASMGLVPFICTSAMSVGRVYEQICRSTSYSCLNVKIITHDGISGDGNNISRLCCEDFALASFIPGMVVLCPSDDAEAKSAVRAAYEYQGPVYLRFSQRAVPVFHDEGMSLQIGKGEVLREGNDIALLATGCMVYEALQAGEILSARGISARIINLTTIQPLDEELVLKAAQECGGIIACEENSVTGSLGEAVCTLLSEKHPAFVRRISIQNTVRRSGAFEEPFWRFEPTADHIVKIAEEAVIQK